VNFTSTGALSHSGGVRTSLYKGKNAESKFLWWDVGTLTPNIGNDTISSIKASPGLYATLYSEAGCWASTGSYWGDTATIGAMDNQTSCLKVAPGVSAYGSQNFVGTPAVFALGGWNHTWLSDVGNDNIESIVVGPGIEARLCAESGAPGSTGWGTCQNFTGSVSSLGALNNNVSNIEVFAGATVYRGIDYTDISQTFRAGTYGAVDLTTIGNDQVSSLIVAPGMKATLCSENSGAGPCKVFTGWNSFVGFVGTGVTRVSLNDRTSYIKIEPI
jgi:hypothetical protein